MNDTYVEKRLVKYLYSLLTPLVEAGWGFNYRTADFERPESLKWFDVFFLTNTPYQKELGTTGRNRYTGILQINVNYDVTDISIKDLLGTDDEIQFAEESENNPDNVYNLLCKGFKRGIVIDKGIRIVSCSRTSSAVLDDDSDHYTDVVTVTWQSDLSID